MSRKQILGRNPGTGRCNRVLVEDGIITSIEGSDETCDLWISAGLIDLQVNGYAGLDFNGEDIVPQTVVELVEAMLTTGVTCFAPTVITAPEAVILRSLRAIADAREGDSLAAACIPFVHMEGPHISPIDGYRGAHPQESVRPPSLAEFDRWQEACGGLVGLVTLSPHFEESEEYISSLTARGVQVSIGHTHASPEQIRNAVVAGARLSTHLGNGIAPQIARHPNPIWCQLANDQMTASFIADGHHLPPEAIKAMVRAKGPDRSILVSNTVAIARMPAGIYTTPVGGRVEMSADGRLSMEGRSTLAGGAIPLVHCIGRAMSMTGWALVDVLTMATVNPDALSETTADCRWADGRILFAFTGPMK